MLTLTAKKTNRSFVYNKPDDYNYGELLTKQVHYIITNWIFSPEFDTPLYEFETESAMLDKLDKLESKEGDEFQVYTYVTVDDEQVGAMKPYNFSY